MSDIIRVYREGFDAWGPRELAFSLLDDVIEVAPLLHDDRRPTPTGILLCLRARGHFNNVVAGRHKSMQALARVRREAVRGAIERRRALGHLTASQVLDLLNRTAAETSCIELEIMLMLGEGVGGD